VILVDNSKSIRAMEQRLIRETTMLLADLIDPGDRISVITFGKGTQQVVSIPIHSDSDRVQFKEIVRRKVKFNEKYSDIRAGIRFLANQRSSLFPTKSAKKVAIVFSDGKLEPADKKTIQAFQEIKRDITKLGADIKIYAVVLGQTASNKTIPGLQLTGWDLMAHTIAGNPALFFQAKQLDQILDIAVTILKRTKGLSSFGEENETSFRIDNTVESMMLVVRKRNVDGSTLATTDEIFLNPPKLEIASTINETSLEAESIYRSNEYSYFELFVVRNPRPGNWSLTLENQNTPVVLGAINSPIVFRAHTKPVYYTNELSYIQAWLADTKNNQISRMSYQLQAHILSSQAIGNKQELGATELYIPLQRDEQTDQYFLEMPDALTKALKVTDESAQINIELVAQKIANPEDESLDPWFLRRSQPIIINFSPPIIRWSKIDRENLRIPITQFRGIFGGKLDLQHVHYHRFDVPPRLTVEIERFDKKTSQFQPYFSETMTFKTKEGEGIFSLSKGFDDYAMYRYSYRLSGMTKGGSTTIESPLYYFNIGFPWIYVCGTVFLLVFVGYMFSSLTAKLEGQIQIETDVYPPDFQVVKVPPKRSFDSAQITNIDLGSAKFKIKAVRNFFVRKRLHITMISNDATFGRMKLPEGKTISLMAGGKHAMNIVHERGYTIYLKISLHI